MWGDKLIELATRCFVSLVFIPKVPPVLIYCVRVLERKKNAVWRYGIHPPPQLTTYSFCATLHVHLNRLYTYPSHCISQHAYILRVLYMCALAWACLDWRAMRLRYFYALWAMCISVRHLCVFTFHRKRRVGSIVYTVHSYMCSSNYCLLGRIQYAAFCREHV